jgi:hypothetical protein
MTRKLTPRRVHDVSSKNYFGWDLRKTEWKTVVWQRSPRLEGDVLIHWPYRLESAQDMTPDFSITVQGDPSDDLLTSWLEEEERGAEMSCVK